MDIKSTFIKYGICTAKHLSKRLPIPSTGDYKEVAMGTMIRALVVTLALVTPALAANGNEVKGSSILFILFLGFGVLIVVFQFIPGMLLFFSMLKGLFTAAPKKAPAGKYNQGFHN